MFKKSPRKRRHLVRPRREPSPRLLRRHLDQLDVGPEGQGRRDHERPLRVPHHGAERRGRRRPSQGDAGDPDDAGRSRDVDDRASGRGSEAAAATAGRLAPDRRPWRQGRSGHVAMRTTTSICPAALTMRAEDHGRCFRWLSYECKRDSLGPARLSCLARIGDRSRSRLPKRHLSGFFHIG